MNRWLGMFIFTAGFVTSQVLLSGLMGNVENWIGNIGKGGSQ